MAFHKLNAEFANILSVMTNPKSKIVIPERADQKYAMCAAMVYLLWKGKDEKDEAQRINGFFRICLELTPEFATMAVSAALEGISKESRPVYAKKLTHNPLFKTWKEKQAKSLKVKA